MKRRFALSICAIMVLILLLPSGVMAHTADNPFVTDLIAGQHIDAGDIKVWNDEENLYVKYETANGWKLTETHLEVEVTLEDIAQTKSGSVKVGKFDYKSEHDPAVEEYTYQIPLDGWYPGLDLYLAAHAVVIKELDCGGYQEETGWGDGEDFGKSWAMYFIYTVQEPPPSCKPFNLPEERVKVTYRYPGAPGSYPGQWIGEETYFDAIMSEIPDGYDFSNGDYDSWCADSTEYIMPQDTYEVKMYSTCSPDLPWYAKDDERWDYINYILNQDYATTLGANWITIQNAMWHFTDANPVVEELPFIEYDPDIAQAIIDDAEANGGGFVPSTGQWAAIILDPNNGQTQTIQLTFIVVDP